MTREEAIKMLNYLATETTGNLADERGEYAEFLVRVIDSLDMAITALREHDSLAKKTSDKKTSEWISVEERLPEKQADVLVLFEHNMAVGFWHDGDEDSTFWCAYTDDGFYTDCDEGPTHWMPLPEPPEVEG